MSDYGRPLMEDNLADDQAASKAMDAVLDALVIGDCGHPIPEGQRRWSVTRYDSTVGHFRPQMVCYGCMMRVDPDSARGPITYAPQVLRIGQR